MFRSFKCSKRFLAIFIAATVLLSAAGCSGKGGSSDTESNTESNTEFNTESDTISQTTQHNDDYFTKNGTGWFHMRYVSYGDGCVYVLLPTRVGEKTSQRIEFPIAIGVNDEVSVMYTENMDLADCPVIDNVGLYCVYYRGYLFVKEFSSGCLYRLTVDGEKITAADQITTVGIQGLTFYDDTIYFIGDKADYRKVRSVSINGENEKILSDSPCNNVTVYDNKLYFETRMGQFCTSDLDGQNAQILLEEAVGYPVIDDDWIYYVSESGANGGSVCKIKTNGLSKTTLYDYPARNLSLYNGMLYFFSNSISTKADLFENVDFCTMNTDGSDFTTIEHYDAPISLDIANGEAYIGYLEGNNSMQYDILTVG